MCDFTEAERQYLTETRSLTQDEEGREVLVGLTYEESAALMAHRREFLAGNRLLDPVALSMWLELAEKHARARPPEHRMPDSEILGIHARNAR
jgi:hypothetical protein